VYNFSRQLETIELVLFILFCVFFIIQAIYYLRIYLPIIYYKPVHSNNKPDPVSIIICARNEADNLQKNLLSILQQKYPKFEVIVVNDCSTDETDDVLGSFLKKHKHLRTTSIPLDKKFSHGKKLAVTVGIKAATYENLVFTDADCRPESENWLMHISQGFANHAIVLGYGGYIYKKSFLNNYIRYDALTVAMQFIGFAIAGIPYMGVGRNLAYKKDLFFKNKGFASNYGLLSGDDDLFINEVGTKDNTAIVIHDESFTRSEPENSFGKLLNQKMRHFSTSGNYKKLHIFLLGMETLSRVWFYTLLCILLTMQNFIVPVLTLALVRLFMQLFVYAKASQKFKEKNLWLSFIIFDVISLFFNFTAYLKLSIRSKKVRWK